MGKSINKCLHLDRVARDCGDVLDRFPCPHCGAKAPGECPISLDKRVTASDEINRASERGGGR